MFTKNATVMLYVEDIQAEFDFWKAASFEILSKETIMDYDTFDMKPHADSTLTFKVYDKAFIKQMSPEVADFQPSVLFETQDITKLHERISGLTDDISPITSAPFVSFNFASPSGIYFAIKEK
ncbi:glyoxalase [Streptococcus hyointestinalis]|uniref:glyoxalase n=1 Tax=Streptococcus hyointestinalis TaxID=1337 RepID=UPI003519873A